MILELYTSFRGERFHSIGAVRGFPSPLPGEDRLDILRRPRADYAPDVQPTREEGRKEME